MFAQVGRIQVTLPFLLALLVLSAPASAQEQRQSRVRGVEQADDPTKSYEFLINKGKLLFEHGQYREASQAFMVACDTARGLREPGCWQRLATVSEKAGLIGVAIDAWNRTAELEPRLAEQANRESSRLRSAFGTVEVNAPSDRRLPSHPIELRYEGMLIDPELKKYIKKFLDFAAVEGIKDAHLWLPAGSYTRGDFSFEVRATETTVVELGKDLVPYRPSAFGLAGAEPARAVPGPWEFSVGFELGAGNAPGDGIGVAPIGLGGRVTIGRRVGPVRVEARFRTGGTLTQSAGTDEELLRQGSAWHVLGQADVGVDLSLRPWLYLTPHVGVVGGSLGELLFACLAEQKQSAVVVSGECRLGAAAIGAQLGADLWFVPATADGRVVFRAGLWAEVLAGKVLSEAGESLAGSSEAHIVRVDSNQFTWIRMGLDIGPSIRF
jgi:hypothetical protein